MHTKTIQPQKKVKLTAMKVCFIIILPFILPSFCISQPHSPTRLTGGCYNVTCIGTNFNLIPMENPNGGVGDTASDLAYTLTSEEKHQQVIAYLDIRLPPYLFYDK